jgi:hypothetical protein
MKSSALAVTILTHCLNRAPVAPGDCPRHKPFAIGRT